MAIISFKSVGKTTRTVQAETLDSSPIPIGIQTPVRSGIIQTDGIFAMHYEISDQIKDNLRNLIETNHGERVGLYDFGANLRELSMELTSREDFESEAMVRIKLAVEKWMPYVTLSGFELTNDFEERNKVGAIRMAISYDLPLLKINNQAIDVILYVA